MRSGTDPASYPELLEWLANQGDPAVVAALAARNSPPAVTTSEPGLQPTPASAQTTVTTAANGQQAGQTTPGESSAPRHRSRVPLFVGVGVLGVGLLAAAAVVLPGEGGDRVVSHFSTVDTSDGPSAVTLAADGSRALVSTWTGGDIAIIDLETGEIDGEIDASGHIGQLLVDPTSGSILTVGPQSVRRVDAANGEVLAAQLVRSASGAAIDETLGEIYVIDPGQPFGDDGVKGVDDRVLVFDVESLDFLREIPIPRAPADVVADVETHRLFIPLSDDPAGRVLVLDAVSGETIEEIPVGETPFAAAIDPASGLLLVSNKGSGTVTFISTTTLGTLGTTDVGGSPAEIAIDGSRGRAYVADYDDPSLSVVDTSTGEVLGNVAAGGVIGGIDVDPQSGTLIVARIFDDQVSLFR